MIKLLTGTVAATMLVVCCSTIKSVAGAEPTPQAESTLELGEPDNPIIISLLPERIADYKNSEDLPLPEFLQLRPSQQNLSFKLVQSESYNQSVSDFCSGKTHIAVLSMVTYAELKKRCDVEELLAIEITGGQSVYHSGIFTHRKNFQRNRARSFYMLERKSIAFGSRYSTTSFHYPLKMLQDMDLLLPDELDEIYLTGSHSAAINKLVNGEVELAAASFQSWSAAVDEGKVNPLLYMSLLKSTSIPLPPLVMNRSLPESVKNQIKRIFKQAHTEAEAEFITGLRGKKVSRYDVETVNEEGYLNSLKNLEAVEFGLLEEVLEKAVFDEVE